VSFPLFKPEKNDYKKYTCKLSKLAKKGFTLTVFIEGVIIITATMENINVKD